LPDTLPVYRQGAAVNRQSSWLHAIVAGAGLVLYVLAFMHQARLAGFPPEFDRGLAYPLLVHGLPAASPSEARRLAEGYAVGTSLDVADATGRRIDIRLPRSRNWVELSTILISGLLYWAVSLLLLAPRSRGSGIRELTWGIFLFGLSVVIGGVYFPRDPVWLASLFNLLQIGCLAALPVLFISIALRFLRPSPALTRMPWLIAALGVMATLSGAWQMFAFQRYYAHPAPERAIELETALGVGRGLLVSQVGAGFWILIARGRRLVLAEEKALLKWLLWGFTIGLFPYVFLRQLPTLLGLAPPWGSELDRLFELSIPLILLFIVARYRFLDIDIIIRRSLIYGIFASAFVVIYLTLGVLVGRRVLSLENGTSWIVLLGIGMLAGFWFRPLRNGIAIWVDRSFFKLSHNYRVALSDLRRRLDAAPSIEESAVLLDRFLETSFDAMGHGVTVACRGRSVRAGTFDGSLSTLDSRSGTFALPGTTNLPALETEPLPKELSEAGLVLYQCHAAPSLTLWLFVGPKRSGRRYVEVDVRLIQDLAVLAGEVMERLFWIQAATEEALERTRLAELDRMKNEFLSRVAHDLRTPLSSIAWSAENLIDGVDGGDASTRARYLRSIKVSASHLNHLVNNLLELSRLEKGAARLETTSLSLEDALHRAALAVAPLAEEKGVTFDIPSESEPIQVLADPDKLLEVVLNLFDNALKYSPKGGRIETRVERVSGERAAFVVRDHGPGLGSLAPTDLFLRYRQGAPSPHASQEGFGLGLHVVKTFMELMGGTVTARTHPEGGAEFTMSLPLAPLPVSK